MTRALATVVYVVLGTGFLVAGISVLLLGSGLLPAAVGDVLEGIGDNNPAALHIMQEFASLLVFAGLITFWFTWHYEKSQAFHWAMTTFWALIALVHWVDIREGLQSGIGPMINTIPFALFLLLGLMRLRAESR